MKLDKLNLKNTLNFNKKTAPRKAAPTKKSAPPKGAPEKRAAMKNGMPKKSASPKKKAPFHGYASAIPHAEPLRRNGKMIIPIGMQTVIAVLVCCGVLLLVGAGLFSSQQMEISELKAEIKSYVDDGVVPAGSMAESVSLNIEAIGGRVDMLQRMIDEAKDGALSGKDIQWMGAQITELQIESDRLNEVITAAEADKALRKSYNQNVQSPLAALSEAYDTMTVNDADIVDTAVKDGAAANTGAFKVTGNLEKSLRWIILAAALIILVVGAFFFRHKIASLFRQLPFVKGTKPEKKSHREGKEKRSGHKHRSAAKKTADGKETHRHPFAEETDEGETAPDVTEEEKAEEQTAINDEESLFAAMAKMEQSKQKNSEQARVIPEPSEAERISFDANVVTQEDIEEDEDPLFQKNND